MIALYDLRKKPWSWDFFVWLVNARARGATAVDFRLRDAVSTKWPMDESLKRFWNYLEPGPRDLAQMPATIDQDGIDIGASYDWREVPSTFERLRLAHPKPRTVQYTVTLRNTFHRKERNSDVEVWRQFAFQIGAHVLEDSQHSPISLIDRYSFYAGARMNYGVANGPVSILFFTSYPVCMFTDPTNSLSVKAWADHGIAPGDRFRWAGDHQHLIWEKPTLASLLTHHKRLNG